MPTSAAHDGDKHHGLGDLFGDGNGDTYSSPVDASGFGANFFNSWVDLEYKNFASHPSHSQSSSTTASSTASTNMDASNADTPLFADSNVQTVSLASSPAVQNTTPTGSTMNDEVTYLSGVTSTGTVAAISGETWNGDGSDSSNPDAVATYNKRRPSPRNGVRAKRLAPPVARRPTTSTPAPTGRPARRLCWAVGWHSGRPSQTSSGSRPTPQPVPRSTSSAATPAASLRLPRPKAMSPSAERRWPARARAPASTSRRTCPGPASDRSALHPIPIRSTPWSTRKGTSWDSIMGAPTTST